jgi:outer membrane protein assembly factor BamB
MQNSTINELRDSLGLGLGIVTRIWHWTAKDWMTNVWAVDIDNDGYVEVIACSRDGRVRMLSAAGDLRWERVVGTKTWVGSIVAIAPSKVDGKDMPARIIVGTRDGKIYVLDKDGNTISKNGKIFTFDNDGRAVEPEQEPEAYWYNTGYVIRQIYVDPDCPTTIIFGSEDRCVYVLDYESGDLVRKHQTNGWVRAVFSCDINGDGKAEILAGSVDKYLYVFDEQGHLLTQHNMGQPVQKILAADIDNDKNIEILVGTDGKDLTALSYHQDESAPHGRFQKKWRTPFDNRILSVCVTDLDNDGKSEIIAGSEDKHIYILDENGKTIWRHNHKFRIFSLYPYDIDNDHIPELLVASENDRVRAMRIRLHKGLLRKIHRYYQRLEESETSFINGLTTNQRDLLQDIVGVNVKERLSLELAEQLMDAGEYEQALSMLLKMQQGKVELLVHKDDIGHIRKVCFRHVASDLKREIIVSNTEGKVQAFNESGQSIWTVQLDDHIVDMQTGFIDHSEQEEIVVCSSDHHVYILGGTRKITQQDIHIDAWMSSICVRVPDEQSHAEILVGSEENKLYIIRDAKETPEIIDTPEGIRAVRAHTSSKANEPEIAVAGLGNRVYACTSSGKILWNYEARDRIPAVGIMDIKGDGNVEVLAGSEDRNIHVLDNAGRLLWRFYLPHSALTFDAADLDQDGRVEIVVGCADGYLHVLSREGDLLWKYGVGDRIHAVCVDDIDGDGNVEIAIGSEDELNLLRVVNQQRISELIYQCWTALSQQQPVTKLVDALLKDSDPFLRAFALSKFAEKQLSARDFDSFERYVKDESIEVRKSLVAIIMAHYMENIVKARQILLQLSMDSDLDVKNSFIENIFVLMKVDWELGLDYLKRFFDHPDRCVRRMVVRKLYHLIDASVEGTADKHRKIFDLLLFAAQDKESEWVRQEAARTLAHFLDRYPRKLIVDVHLLIVNEIQLKILQHIAHAAVTPFVKRYLNAAIHLLSDLNDENVLGRAQEIVDALEKVSEVDFSHDLYIIYAELRELLTFHSISDIAQYLCSLNENQFVPDNEFAHIILDVFRKLSLISWTLRIYLRREDLPDRLSSLLDAIAAIDEMSKDLERLFSLPLMGIPITKLPNHQVFILLLQRWRSLVMAKLNELRGKAELKAELSARQMRYENQVGIWLTVRNEGRSSASKVNIMLLPGNNFSVTGKKSYETDVILPQEEKIVEFLLIPQTTRLDLRFQFTYSDAEKDEKIDEFVDRLELSESPQEFGYIPNPYSTGTPTHDSKMFYGREADMTFLRDNMTRNAKTVLVLYGQRRSGKTTLLLQLINTSAFGEHIAVLIDMQRMSYNINIHRFLYKMAHAIAQAMKRNHLQICEPMQGDFEADPTGAFDGFLDDVEEQLKERKLILMVDEFEVLEEQVVRGKLEPEIFEYLRDILQHRQNINFLFSGTHKIMEYTKWYRSVFFNIARHYRLSRISPSGAEALIQQPVAGYLEYEPLTVAKIRQLTADQPYLIHLLCRAIVDYCNDRRKTYVTINDVNTVLREVMQTIHFHFDWLWDQISPEERVTLSALAEGSKEEGRWLTLDEIVEIYQRNHIPFKREYLLASLNTLIDADIIEDKSNDYKTLDSSRFRIPVGLTQRWLLRDRPLELVRRELGG